MLEIIGSGDPIAQSVPIIDYAAIFAGYRMLAHHLCYASNLTDVDGRAAAWASSRAGGAPLYQSTPARCPLIIPGGGPGGVTSALRFTQAEASAYACDEVMAITAGATYTRAMVCQNNILETDNAENEQAWGGPNSGNNRDYWYFRRNASTSYLHAAVIGTSPSNLGGGSQPMPANTWALVTLTINTTTLDVTFGRRSAGESSLTLTTVRGAAGMAIANRVWSLGGNTDMTVAGLLALECDLLNDADARGAIQAWAFGPDSAIGLS